MSQAVFVDDENAPMRICTGQDPSRADVAVVNVANKRGAALLLTAPVAPTWVYQTGLGNEVGDWPVNLLITAVGKLETPSSVAERTWLVPPGQQVHMGFSQASLDGVADRHRSSASTPRKASLWAYRQDPLRRHVSMVGLRRSRSLCPGCCRWRRRRTARGDRCRGHCREACQVLRVSVAATYGTGPTGFGLAHALIAARVRSDEPGWVSDHIERAARFV